ncbi:hypothetical protein B4102_3529 [Heyndrickxia sporothermodurans]|uniref:DUF2975 domain-containing protein n=1 Tax=Heyndrickxia sporothermodurans TaxID=46224 RepID=A0A150KM20_9BACI|nr:DUF2975 domain-containing protein [Heyndrickxia sporothermodurans]KYC97015.1 hypothetical protein B4102_3529 [Heyndrickxia sporothermodurans]MED3780029.1 DUF2975 domain-containing protein [Heyndrickxia sporothermodurans]
MKQGTTTFLKLAILIIGIIILAFCIFLLPGLASEAAKENPEYAFLRFPVLVGAVIIFATLVISFFSAVLQHSLRSALEFKTENDLTV